MKYLLLFIISINAFSANWVSHSNLKGGKAEGFTFKAECERVKSEPCYDIEDNNVSIYSEVTIGEGEDAKQVMVLDPIKQSAFEADQLAKTQVASDETALANAVKRIDCGKKVIARMLLRNEPKNLSTAQVAQVASTYAAIKGLLETGSLVTAKEAIQAVTPDGVLVSEADKTALVVEINKCLGL